jgi:uncharacterized glyoxalase superfamily protein PhnB
MQLQPYLFFDGRCEEAIEFYRRVLNAEVLMMMRMKDSPEPPPPGSPPGSENKILHASLRIGETALSASDGMNRGKPSFEGFSIALSVPTEAEPSVCSRRSRTAATRRCRSRDLLLSTLRHADGSVRRGLDGHGRTEALTPFAGGRHGSMAAGSRAGAHFPRASAGPALQRSTQRSIIPG